MRFEETAALASFHFSFTVRRSDFMATIALLAHRPVGYRLVLMMLWLLVVFTILLVMSGTERIGTIMLFVLQGRLPWPIYAAQAAVLAAIWFRGELVGAASGLVFRNYANAGREVFVTIDEIGIKGGSSDTRFCVTWDGIRRVIESPRHIVLAIAPSQGIVLPRRAVASAEDYAAVRDLIARRVRWHETRRRLFQRAP